MATAIRTVGGGISWPFYKLILELSWTSVNILFNEVKYLTLKEKVC
jgi:hypothetical protein